MSTELGFDQNSLHEEYDGQGERIRLPDEVIAQLTARGHPPRYAAVTRVSLASFARDVRQV